MLEHLSIHPFYGTLSRQTNKGWSYPRWNEKISTTGWGVGRGWTAEKFDYITFIKNNNDLLKPVCVPIHMCLWIYEKSSIHNGLFSQFNSVTQSCPTLCGSMDCSMPGFPVRDQLPELAQTHVNIELMMAPNHLILCPPLLLLPSMFPSIRVFSNESALRIRWPKCWSFESQDQSFQ